MPKMRVHEVAKLYNKSSKEVIAALKQQGVEVQSHMSTVTEENVSKLKGMFQPAGGEKKAAPAQEKAEQPKRRDEAKEKPQANRADRRNDGGKNGENRNQNNRGGENRADGRGNDNRGDKSNRGGRDGRNNDGARGGRDGSRNHGDGSRNQNNRSGENRGDGRGSDNRGDRGNRGGRDGRNNDGARGGRDGSRNQNSRGGENRGNDNRGDRGNRGNDGNRRNDRRNRNKSVLGGDTPINAKETRNGKENRHDINREHSRENQNRNEDSRDSRGGRNNRKNNNRNNNYNNNNNQKRGKNKGKQPVIQQPVKHEEPKEEVIRNITLPDPVSLKDLADACKVTPATIIKKLFMAGQMVTINTEFSFDEAAEIALDYNCIAEEEVQVDVIEELLKEEEDDESTLVSRPPVVCVMGHVDHGKTSLLDAIRSTHVTEGEAGGITQHIGAYVVNINDEKITFLDTPGHEAFTSMRLRGAQATDIAVLVVAADDGVMPQTVEAINHAKAAEVEVIVAVNKIDKEGANVERVKQELTEYGLIAEDWGGSTVFVPVSAKTGEGIQDLLEMISLTAEVLELKANPNRKARGLVIEAKLDKGRGPVATILIQKGTLHVGDCINIGHTYGRVRAMLDDKGNRVKAAGPSVPVEILGLNDVPFSGEVMMAHDSEKEARTTAEAFVAYSREKMLEETKSKLSLDDLFDQIQAGNVKELNLVVKADVQGSVEAVKQSLTKLSNEEVMIKVIHGGVGAINESDVTLASASNAIIIGFNVRPDTMAKSVAEREKVDMRLYRVIYNAIEDIEAAMKGMLDPVYREKVTGHLEVRQIYKASGVGTIAGCYVTDGEIARTSQTRIVRDGIVIYEGMLASLKRFKDDVKEVKAGFECGLVFEKYNDVKEGDQIEAFVMEEVPR
ncbi:MAG TPA: translation initiation factor IF-2 [Candidatus Anaerobutyricum stercoripullorum]|uniref:Translation initiation factor IF-2 n=1 Tax=Candidatus Anaerobutyricum stercoripullorum TaxID=2838456 RepID=A0A9D2BDF8_9FIRM|nr:translation initiation factor IF-2 [Candidatus Anaerobutyricum stercoripullorum]